MDDDMHFKFVQDRIRIRILWDELRWRNRFTVCYQQAGMGYGQLIYIFEMHNLHPFQRRCQNLEIIRQFLNFGIFFGMFYDVVLLLCL